MTSGIKAAGAIRSLVNARSLQVECARVLHKSVFMPVLMYGSKTDMEEGEVYDYGCTDGQPKRFDGMVIKSMDRVLNAWSANY